MNPPATQSQMEAIRQRAERKAVESLRASGVNLSSQEALMSVNAAVEAAEDKTWQRAYEASLRGLYDKGVGGIRFIDNSNDAKLLGTAYFPEGDEAYSREDLDGFARLQADQFVKGWKPIDWDTWNTSRRGLLEANTDAVIGGAITSFEGMVGTMFAGVRGTWDVYGWGGALWGGDITTPQLMANMMEARNVGVEGARLYLSSSLEGVFGDYIEKVAGEDPNAPVLASERIGIPSGDLAALMIPEAEAVGQALGSLPFSIPSMLAPNTSVAVAAAVPFAFAGYADAKFARWDIYQEQVRTAEMMGIEPPPMPSFAEMETWGGVGALFEAGSEFVGDGLQRAGMKLVAGRKLGGRFGSTSVARALGELRASAMSSRGALGFAKRVGLAAAAVSGGSLSEGGEEIIPSIGGQVQEGLTALLFQENPDYWSIDRPFFDPEGAFYLDEDVRHGFKVGAYAGGLFSGGHYMGTRAGAAVKNRGLAREVKKGGTSFATDALRQRAEADALIRFKRNAVSTRSSAMALHHVEQLANDERLAMFVDPADASFTMTKEVKARMKALGISTKPIGTIGGKQVYAANGNAQQVRDLLNSGAVQEVTGSPLVNDGDNIRGAVVFRDAGGRIVDVMPFSDPTQLMSEGAALAEYAQRNGLSVDVSSDLDTAEYGKINDQLRRQMDADAEDAGKPNTEQKAVPKRVVNRGKKALRLDIERAARGSKVKPKAKKTDPFTSDMLTAEEIGDAKNGDVTVTVVLDTVAEENLSEGERSITRAMRSANATVLDGKIIWSIKNPDGTVRTIEKPIPMDGSYVSQSNPDGVFLIRENGTAMTARSAFAIALHEMRHRTLSRSRAGALYFAKLLQIDPVYAMRGGASYMRARFRKHSGRSDAQIVAYYRGLYEAAMAVQQGVATQQQQEMVNEADGVAKAMSEVATFAEESVTTTANRAIGTTVRLAAEWDPLHKNAQDKAFGSFSRWLANALVSNGFAGPEARQALFELRQRLDGVREEELQIHQKFSSDVSKAVADDMAKAEKANASRAALRQSMQQNAAGQAAPAQTTTPAGAAPAQAPSAASPTAAPSLRPTATPRASTVAGDEDKKAIEQAAAAIEEAKTADPERSSSLLTNAIDILTMLANTQAQVSSTTTPVSPEFRQSRTRPVPPSMAPQAAEAEQAAPADMDYASRIQEAKDAAAIIIGDRPTGPVRPNTVARIQRTQVFTQTPEEEIRYSAPNRPGRRDANEDIRSIRNAFMQDRGIEPEQRIEDTYAEIDPDFAKRVADWFESAKVDYNDPEMLAAYQQFGRETLDQYNYLRSQGYEIIPWAGEGQPYADSEDMIEDLRENKRLFYFKTINPEEANSFGSDPAAFQEALKRNPLLADSGVEVLDSNGEPYRQTYNDLFRGVHDILGHGAEGFQFGPRGEENAYRSHAVMFSPLARRAMATETRAQNSWVNFGPNRRNPDGSVWGQEDPRYGPWLDALKRGEGYADQKPILTPVELTAMYSVRDQASGGDAISEPFYHAVISDGFGSGSRIVGHTGRFRTFDEAREAAKLYEKQARDPVTDVFRVEGGAGAVVDAQRDTQPAEDERPAAWMTSPKSTRSSRAEAPERIMYSDDRAKRSKKVSAAKQSRASAKKPKRPADAAKLDAPAISVSAEVTAQPFINPNIITTEAANDPQFTVEDAYRRVNERVADLLGNSTYRTTLGKLVSAATGGRIKLIGKPRKILGVYGSRVEESMRISIAGAKHEDHARVGNLLGSLLLQEATITIGEMTPNTPEGERAHAVILKGDKKLSDADMRTLLQQASSALGGASSLEDGTGVWSVYTPFDGNPITQSQFAAGALQLANSTGMTLTNRPVRSTYTTTGDTDVLGRSKKDVPRGGSGRSKRRGVPKAWDPWVNAAAPIVEALRDEGFDIDIPGWIGKIAGPDAAAVENALIELLAQRAAGGRHGLDWRFIHRAAVTGQGLTTGFAIPAKTTPANAERSFAEVDALLGRHPNALKDDASFERFLIDLFKSRDIPVVPSDLIKNLKSNAKIMRAEMNLRSNGGRLTNKMIDEAIHGLEMAQRFRQLYASGNVTPTHTAMLAMWGFLSRGVSPYIQESLFLDIVNYRAADGKDLNYFVGIAIEGKWTKPERDAEGNIIQPDTSTDTEWKKWIQGMFSDLQYDSTDGVTDAAGDLVSKTGTPGVAASHNANAFGISFLGNIGRAVTVNGKTQSALLHFHDTLKDPTKTGKDVRRMFASFGGSLGIDNKVVGFAALVAGKTDISVYDRVRVRDHFDRAKSYPNIYDGYTVGYSVYDGDKVADFIVEKDFRNLTAEQRAELLAGPKAEAQKLADELNKKPRPRDKKGKEIKATIRPAKIGGLANLFNGARGIAIYEATERAIDPNKVFRDLLKVRPDLAKYANHGAEHWLNWVGSSAQEASHKTLDGLIEMIAGGKNKIDSIWAKEGRYDTFSYGAEYGYKEIGGVLKPMFRYELDGVTWEMTPANYHSLIKAITAYDWASVNFTPSRGAKKPKFAVMTDSATGGERTEPWHADPLVGAKGRQIIAEMADARGERVSASLRGPTLDANLLSVKSVMSDEIKAAAKVRVLPPAMDDYLAGNLGAIDQRGAYAIYRYMLKESAGTPTEPRYIRYFLNNNALNGIMPRNLWFHGGYGAFTVPNPDIKRNQFGLHIGNFDQASEFFGKRLAQRVSNPILMPLYARSEKPLVLPDMGAWEPERLLAGMVRMNHITADEAFDIAKQMYRDTSMDRFEIGWDTMSPENYETLLNELAVDLDGLDRMRARNGWMRDFLGNQGYDSILYRNAEEGRNASRFAWDPDEGGEWTEEYREYMLAKERRANAYTEAVHKYRAAHGSYPKDPQIVEFTLEHDPEQMAAIIWNDGHVKSATVSDNEYRITSPDIRASMRIEPPAVVAMNSSLFIDEVPARMSMREGLMGQKDAAVVAFVDKYDEIRRYQDQFESTTGLAIPDIANPYQGARVLTGRLGAMQKEAQREYAEILRDMHENGISLEQMDEFLVAQHALGGGNEYIAQINPRFPDDGTPGSGGTGMTSVEAQQVIDRQINLGRFGEMNRIAEDWRQLLRAGLVQRRDAGLITQETYNNLTSRYTHYVPLRGAPGRPVDEIFEDYDSGEVFGRGMSSQGRGMPARTGRASMAEGVTSQVGFLHEDTMRRIARNEIGQRFLRLVLMMNDPTMARVIRPRRTVVVNGQTQQQLDPTWMSRPENFGVYINQPMTINGHQYEAGDLVIIELLNTRLADALTTPDAQLTQFDQALRTVNNAWRFMTTGMGNPTFAPVNLVRDLGAGLLTNYAAHGARDTAQMLRRYPSAFYRVFRDAWFNPDNPTGTYAEFIAAGGDQVYWRPNDLQSKQTDFDDLARRVARRDPNDRTLARTLLGWYPAFFTAAETATRLAQYEQRLATGASREQAALAGREITVDFAKGGKKKAPINTWYMFLNASIQGSANVTRALGRAATLAPALATFGMVNAMIGRALGGDDDETGGSVWDNIPDYEKASNIIIMDPSGSGKYIKIPLPYGYNTFYSAGVRLADAALGPQTVGDAIAGSISDAMNSFNPFGGSGIKNGPGNILTAFAPTMVRPMFEVALNQNWMGRPIYPQSFGKQKKADAYSYFEGTPEMYTNTAQALNELGGGDMFESGGPWQSMDISPNTMQYLVGYYLSGFGRNMDRLMKAAFSDQPTEIADIPIARSFVGDAKGDTRSLGERYNAIAGRVMPDINRAEAMRDPAVPLDVRQSLRERGVNPENIEMGRIVEQTDKKLRDIRKRMKGATPEQREKLREVRERAMKRVIRENNRLTD